MHSRHQWPSWHREGRCVHHRKEQIKSRKRSKSSDSHSFGPSFSVDEWKHKQYSHGGARCVGYRRLPGPRIRRSSQGRSKNASLQPQRSKRSRDVEHISENVSDNLGMANIHPPGILPNIDKIHELLILGGHFVRKSSRLNRHGADFV